jgi:dipeptidyl aminopeptidase/acylaminoacyl peptidase
MARQRGLNLTQLVSVPSVWNYAIAPDSERAAVVWDKPGLSQIFLVPLQGEGRARQITRGKEATAAPSFSPDGTRLVYAQDYGGDENYDLFIHDLGAQTTRNLTPDTPDESINPDVSWSPDGRWLAYVSNASGRYVTYVRAADGSGTPRRMTQHDYSDTHAEWSPDGRHLAVCAWTVGQEAWVFVVPAADGARGEPVIVGGPAGPIDAVLPSWAPDSRRLAVASHATGITTIQVFDLNTRTLTQITPNTHEAGEPAWSPDGRRLAYTWNEDGEVSVRVHDFDDGSAATLRVGPGVHSHPRFTPDGQHLLALFNGARHPSDLWAFDLRKGFKRARARAVTDSLPKRVDRRDFVMPRTVRWQCDGLTIPGLLYAPRGLRRARPGRGRAPAVVWVHGGPTWQFKNEWWVGVQYLVSKGCVVLAPNYRGSSGYGRAFQEANRFDLGGGDMRDVLGGAAYLVERGYADPRRIAITGTSYGGYLTMTALTRHPEVFAAGAAVVPFLNWFTEHENEREDLQYWDLQNFGDPVRDADRYREYSPIFAMENITAPVQMIAGANDPRCPASETEQAELALQDLGVPYEVIIYPGEGHAFHQKANRVDAMRRRMKFLLRHLRVGKR